MAGQMMAKDEEMVGLDSAFEKTKDIVDAAVLNVESIKTEEDAKLQIITRIITEGLKWSLSDIGAEVKHDNGYSDYLLSNDGKPALIIEGVITKSGVQSDLKKSGVSG